MSAIAHQRCWNHAQREAVARCPECRHYFCRECVVEHEDRVLCASCLRQIADEAQEQGGRLAFAARSAALVAGLLLVWTFFYLLGRGLITVPSEFHEITLWAVEPGAPQ
ncbi:MAG: hypothetical protein AMXMBFR4_11750 [Candidatus Hydrogenedentota bacterium]